MGEPCGCNEGRVSTCSVPSFVPTSRKPSLVYSTDATRAEPTLCTSDQLSGPCVPRFYGEVSVDSGQGQSVRSPVHVLESAEVIVVLDQRPEPSRRDVTHLQDEAGTSVVGVADAASVG